MSYLKLLPTPSLNLNKATLSVWFRVPKAAADALQWFEFVPDFDVFDGVVPILVLDTQKQGTVTDFSWTIIGYTFGPDDPPFYLGGPPTVPLHELLPAGTHQGKMAPTFIGVDKDGYLSLHLQTGDVGAASQINFNLIRYEIIFHETDPGFYFTTTEMEYTNTSGREFPFPDSLGNAGMPSGAISLWERIGPSDFGFQVSFDQWHHLLLSWDIGVRNASHGTLSGPLDDMFTYVDAVSTLYCAVDDVNRNGDELPGLRYPGMAANATISYGTYSVAGVTNSASQGQHGGATAAPTYNLAFDVGCQADGVFTPSETEYSITQPVYSGVGPEPGVGPGVISPNQHVELAELQIFAGVTIDTGDQGYRRAFVDGAGKPVDPAEAEKLIGRRPDILLHGSSNWIAGRNTGSIGLTRPAVSIPAGQFVPTGKIDPYSPDPSLHGPQGSAA